MADDEVIDEDLEEGEFEEDPDADELEDDLDEVLPIGDDADDEVVATDEDEDEDESIEAAARRRPRKEEPEEEEDDDEDVDPDDVEADLDAILKDRIAATDDDDDDDEDVVVEADTAGESSTRIQPRRPGEFLCQSCFLVKHPSQLADPDAMLCKDCV